MFVTIIVPMYNQLNFNKGRTKFNVVQSFQTTQHHIAVIIVIVTASFFALIPLVLRTTRHWVHHSRLALLFICDKLLSRNVGELYSVTSRIIMLKVHFLAVVISYVSAKRKYNVRYKEVKNAEGLKSLLKGQENR